jgi:PAS domain S-box-containing protein
MVHETILIEFQNLLQKKARHEERLDSVKNLIKQIMQTYSEGLVIEQKSSLMDLLRGESQKFSPELNQALKHPEIGGIICDENDIIIDISNNLITSLGYQPDELIGAYKGKLWVERPNEKDSSYPGKVEYLIYRVKQKHFDSTHEDAYITHDDRVVSVLEHRLNIIDLHGNIIGLLYLILDLTEEKSIDLSLTEAMDQIERELLENDQMELTLEMRRYIVKDILRTKEYLSNILNNSLDGILITSPSGHILGFNQSFKRMVGYTDTELRNQPMTILYPITGTHTVTSGEIITIEEEYVRTIAEMLNSLFENEKVYTFRQYFTHKDGNLIPTEVNLSLIKDRRGEIIGILRNVHDLTEKERLRKEISEKEEKITLLQKELTQPYQLDNIVGKSRSMQEIFYLLKKVAESESTVLIQGESGTGKELIARAIYHHSPRDKGPFITLNCGAIPTNLLESELFGHVKGSFTGAIRDKKGLFEEANGGVIFLDEVGELPLDMQVKLLRTIQQREIKRVGDNRSIKIDVRIIAATHKDLLEETRKGLFRDDLYYRINVFSIKIPPLRERNEDIPLLIDFFLKNSGPEGSKTRVSREAMKVFLNYPFPGNIRELENIIERALILCEDHIIKVNDLPPEVAETAQVRIKRCEPLEEGMRKNVISKDYGLFEKTIGINEYTPPEEEIKKEALLEEGLKQALNRERELAEKDILMKALKKTKYNKTVAAKILKIGRTSLYRKLKKLHLEV